MLPFHFLSFPLLTTSSQTLSRVLGRSVKSIGDRAKTEAEGLEKVIDTVVESFMSTGEKKQEVQQPQWFVKRGITRFWDKRNAMMCKLQGISDDENATDMQTS